MNPKRIVTTLASVLMATMAWAQSDGITTEGTMLKGTLENQRLSGGVAVLRNGTNGLGFYPITSTTTIKANTAYLPEGRQLLIDLASLDSPLTSMQETEMLNVKTTDGRCYDLNGRIIVTSKSSNGRLPAGVYVKNKQKFIVKP